MSDLSGNKISDYVAQYYDQQAQREWERIERHRTEFAVTLRALKKHLPLCAPGTSPVRVLDCGGGPGRYAIELARQGYQVTLFDLSDGNLRLAKDKAQEAGVSLQGYEQGTALDLSRFPDEVFDVVLLMGPLYHLLELDERRQALAEARRVLKWGGSLLASFITRYAAHRWSALKEPQWVVNEVEISQALLDSGRLPPREGRPEGFVAYMAHPTEVVPLCWQSGLEVVETLGVEGVVSQIEEQVNALTGEAWERWVDLNERLAPDPSIHGCTEHLLAVTVKPRWRAVLRRIAQRLDETGIAYKVVGGACAALHGLPLHVRDIDIEVSAADAYRFQQLFPAQVTLPVALGETELYRSHFGCFDFEGVQVEIMGDNQRREMDGWAPTRTQTEEFIDLDGVAVRVSWLEEETLAYIRRGRLERAAQCLARGDRARLLALMRREVQSEVF